MAGGLIKGGAKPDSDLFDIWEQAPLKLVLSHWNDEEEAKVISRLKLNDMKGLKLRNIATESESEPGALETILLLLKTGAGINDSPLWDDTPLQYAASGGYSVLTKLLLDEGADPTYISPNMSDNKFSNPLHAAVRSGNVYVTKMLSASDRDAVEAVFENAVKDVANLDGIEEIKNMGNGSEDCRESVHGLYVMGNIGAILSLRS